MMFVVAVFIHKVNLSIAPMIALPYSVVAQERGLKYWDLKHDDIKMEQIMTPYGTIIKKMDAHQMFRKLRQSKNNSKTF